MVFTRQQSGYFLLQITYRGVKDINSKIIIWILEKKIDFFFQTFTFGFKKISKGGGFALSTLNIFSLYCYENLVKIISRERPRWTKSSMSIGVSIFRNSIFTKKYLLPQFSRYQDAFFSYYTALKPMGTEFWIIAPRKFHVPPPSQISNR